MTVSSNLKPNQFINDRYKIVAAINHGSFGSVSLAKDTWARNTLVAIKCIIKQKDDPTALDEAREEIAIHKRLGHYKYICSILDSFEDEDATYLVMEYCPEGDLYEAIRADKGPGPSDVLSFMLQLIDAVQYAHNHGVYHRDIKPENILIAQDGSVRLADWGLATTQRINSEFGVGSERYMAPELFDQDNIDSYDAEKVDIWSLGICLLNILFGRNPFTSASQKDKLFLDFAYDREALFDIFPTLSEDTFLCLRHSLTLDPDNRSLERFRESLCQIVSWTTDEEDYYYNDTPLPANSSQVSLSDVSINNGSSRKNPVNSTTASQTPTDLSRAPSSTSSRSFSSHPASSRRHPASAASNIPSATTTNSTPIAGIPIKVDAAPVAVPVVSLAAAVAPSTPTTSASTAPNPVATIAPTTATKQAPATEPVPIASADSGILTVTTANDPLATTAPPTNLLRPPYNTPTNGPSTSSNISTSILATGTASIPSATLHKIVPTNNNREPLRTPLNMSHQILSESLLSHSWSRTMQFTPPNPSYFANHHNAGISASHNSGSSRGVSQSRYYDNGKRVSNAYSTGAPGTLAPSHQGRLYMESVTEEEDYNDHHDGTTSASPRHDESDHDDGDEVFAMDELGSALSDLGRNMHDAHTDDMLSVYSVPSLVPSTDDSISSVNSSRRSVVMGASNPVGYSSVVRRNAAAAATTATSTGGTPCTTASGTPTVSSPTTASNTAAKPISSATATPTPSSIVIPRNNALWNSFNFDDFDDDFDDDDFDEYEVQRMLDLTEHSFSRTPLFPSSLSSKTGAHVRVASPLRSEMALDQNTDGSSSTINSSTTGGATTGTAGNNSSSNAKLAPKKFGSGGTGVPPMMSSRNNNWAVPTLS